MVLVNAGDYGGIRNQFILCRNINGQIISLDTETELKDPGEHPEIQSNQTVSSIKPLNEPLFPELSQNLFLAEGIKQLNVSQYPNGINSQVIPSLNQARESLKRSIQWPILISVVTPKGKRIDFNNNDLISLQKKADGHGSVTMEFDSENINFDVNAIIENVKKGVRAMLIPETENFSQSFKSHVSQKRSASEAKENQAAKKKKL